MYSRITRRPWPGGRHQRVAGSHCRAGQSDEKKAFENYSDNVNKMDDLGKRLFERADQMRVQQRNYFEEWRMQGNTYTNPQIQALSEQRRADLNVTFAISRGERGSERIVQGLYVPHWTDQNLSLQ